ncbi:hypothetical protein WICMUC_002038 [Wickerhamomyces mucosus]|uniref:Uncharacterized protein n=1 Tax=Wickerhamomyces mucosus TaxID=1378264 RepID=A0A9P8PRS3_9ASCO|nr:hypothetical protein WICMUC_002038 [Wickerhamomyces mucosus]
MITRKSLRLVKDIIDNDLSPFQKLSNIWRQHGTSSTNLKEEDIDSDNDHSRDDSNQNKTFKVNAEKLCCKKSQSLQTKNLQIVTREDIISNRYELDPYHGSRFKTKNQSSKSSSLSSRQFSKLRISSSTPPRRIRSKSLVLSGSEKMVSLMPNSSIKSHSTTKIQQLSSISKNEDVFQNEIINQADKLFTETFHETSANGQLVITHSIDELELGMISLRLNNG